jgi:sugar lactone lactonase YvrE
VNRFWLLAGLGTLILSTPATAVTTRTWRVTTYRDFDEGETTGVLLSSLGDASVGFSATRIDLPEAQVFSSVVAPDGSIWLGTGDRAQLYRYEPKNGVQKVAQLEGVLVGALAAGHDGTIYAGTVPGGSVWKIQGGKAHELCRLEGAEHVWSLLISGSTLYAGTGPQGHIYAIDPATGKSRIFWDSGGKHILALAPDGPNGLLAGSADEAILYRIARDGTARAVHDFQGEEVRAVARRGDTIYVAVNEFEKPTSGSATPANKPQGTKIIVPSGASGATTATRSRDRKGKGAVYRIDPDGRVEQLHAVGDNYLTALHVDREGNVYAAAGSSGRLYLIRPDRTVLTAFDFPERQVLTLALGGRTPVLGTGDAGALYLLDFAPPKDARYLSKVFDANFLSRWGSVRWAADGEVAIETRSGSTARPDRTWSPWQTPAHGESAGARSGLHEGKVVSPPGRYLQFRASFGRNALLRDVTIFYLPQNQMPRVTEVNVGDDAGRTVRSASGTGKPRSPIIKIKWRVENPDDDELVYRLWYRAEEDGNWKPLGGPEPLTAREWDWNTEAIPDGNYVVKVSVSDAPSSPREDALEHTLVSAPFLIDNRKPEVMDLKVAYPLVTGLARDSFSPIAELAYSIDGGDWQLFAPRDSILDQSMEEFVLRLPDRLSAGTHSIAVRTVDLAENVGTGQVTFSVAR